MKRNGFTLIEILMAMFVGAIIMAVVYGVMVLAQKNSSNLDRKVVTQQDTRTVLDLMAMDIRMASYNPASYKVLHETDAWSNTSLACVPSVATTYKGIKSAGTNSIAIAMDLNGSGIIGDASNEYIVYSYDGDSTLSRSVNCGTATAILGGSAPFTNVRNATAGVTLFQYFDKNDAPLSMPAGIPDIRRILITLVSDTSENDVNTGKPKRMVYATNVIVRNHVLSP